MDRPQFTGRVLVADDNTTNQKIARLALESFGCHVDLAADGREAVALLQTLPYDLVFMDCAMPEMDGFEATRAIRAQETRLERGEGTAIRESTFARFRATGTRIPIIAMTAKALAGNRENCLVAGMDDYLSKPVTLDALQRMLARWLPIAPTVPADSSHPSLSVVAVAAPTDDDALDRVTVEHWRTVADNMGSDLFIEVLGIFRSEAPRQVQAIRDAAEARDARTLHHTAHKLRGASLNLGALGLAEWAARLERLGEDGTSDGVVAQLAAGDAELARVIAAIERELAVP